MTSLTSLSRRRLLAAGAAVSGALAMPGLARAKAASIVVASSGGKLEEAYQAAYYKPFTSKTGIGIVGTANTYAKLKAMVDAKAVEWDVAQVDAAVAATMAAQGLLEPLDYGIIDKSRLFPGIARESYMPSDLVACVIAWNTKSVAAAAAPRTWADLWDLKRFAGQRGFWKQPFQTMEIALLADGVARDKLYPLDVDRALKSLGRIKPDIFWWGSGAQSAQILIDGEVAAQMGWNGRLIDPRRDGAPIDYHFNESLYVSDAWVVPRGAKNRTEAMEFIAFALDAERQAAFSEVIPYGPVNQDALKFVRKERLPELASSDQNFKGGVMQDFDWWAKNGAEAGRRFNAWMLS